MQAVENARPAIGWSTRSATRLVMPESRAQYKRDPLTNYELKTELGFDHFEGRSYPGWQHHVVLSAVGYAFLQRERYPTDAESPEVVVARRIRTTCQSRQFGRNWNN